MQRAQYRDRLYPDCPVRNILSRIGDKWSMLVLFTLEEHTPIRFKELQRAIPDISQKMLTTTLKTLEADGLLIRKAYPATPPRVEYSLTERGLSLLPLIDKLLLWAQNNMDDILAERRKYLLKD